MSVTFMKGCVGSSQYWLPKCTEIKLLNCVDAPSRLDLAKMVSARMLVANMGLPREPFDSSFKRTAEEIVRKPPNVDWLLAMLSTMDPESVIFRKDYVKPKVLKFTDPDLDQAEMVDNVEGFFDGLPVAVRSKK